MKTTQSTTEMELETTMRRTLIIALGLAGLGAIGHANAWADKECAPHIQPVPLPPGATCRLGPSGLPVDCTQGPLIKAYEDCVANKDKAAKAEAAKQQKQDYLNMLHGNSGAAATTASGTHVTTSPTSQAASGNILQTGRKPTQPK